MLWNDVFYDETVSENAYFEDTKEETLRYNINVASTNNRIRDNLSVNTTNSLTLKYASDTFMQILEIKMLKAQLKRKAKATIKNNSIMTRGTNILYLRK